MRDPRDIYQDNLNEVAVRLWARDFDGVVGRLLVPNDGGSGEGVAQIDDAAAIRRHLSEYCRMLDDLGAEGYHRLCLEASYTSPEGTRILGRHRTFVLKGGAYVIAPYDCEMDLQLLDDEWKASGLRLLANDMDVTIIDPAEFRDGPSKRGEGP